MNQESSPDVPGRAAGASNRLARETSPYLLQHAANPVDWFPWGAEALGRARREDRPVFLSVGYSSCHWCHVMAHESFEDPGVAAVLNRHFVCIKVDREERPDLDAIYLRATQAMTGRGGWPNSVWLTPDGRPWFAGTYFPRDDVPGSIGFRTLCERLAGAWQGRRAEVEAQADELTRAVRADIAGAPAPASAPPPVAADPPAAAVSELRKQFDPVHGGFGGAPKFPPHGEIALLLDAWELRGDRDALDMAERTLGAMYRGGLHDHVGGGFHRYSTDERWFLPHFEKMLGENALLAANYARAFRLTGAEAHARAARGIGDWMLREMASPEGGFHAALDADSAGGEGRYYLWSTAELAAALPPDDLAFAVGSLGAGPAGHVRDEATGRATGLCLLQRMALPPGREADAERVFAALRAVRDRRARPGLDGKILASWNGLAIGALASAGRALGEPRFAAAAERAAEFAWSRLRDASGRLCRTCTGGVTAHPACLDDHAFLADGFLDLHEAGGDARWLDRAAELAAAMIGRFRDPGRGGFFFTADDHEPLIARLKDPFDGALPSGNAVACLVLQRLRRRTDSELYRVMAEETLRAFAGAIARAPRAMPAFVRAVIRSAAPPASAPAPAPRTPPTAAT